MTFESLDTLFIGEQTIWINSENYIMYAKFVTKDFLDFTF